MRYWFIAATALFGCVAGAVETVAEIPEQFRGTWASSETRCMLGGESMLTIHALAVDFYESRGKVLAVATDDKSELAVLLESSGEGQTWLNARQFRLSDDQQTLTDVTGGALSFPRVRCPAKAK